MNLLTREELQKLIATHHDLTRERREALVEFMQSLTPGELDEMLRSPETPSDEIPFLRACVGLAPLEGRELRSLQHPEAA